MHQRNRLAIALSWPQGGRCDVTADDLDGYAKVGPRSIFS
jgi:hypothetical protein